MKISEAISSIEELAPLTAQDSWDNSGIQVMPTDTAVTGALLAIDITEAVIDEATELNCNLVISHHPLIFGGVKHIDQSDATGRIILKAIRNGITIYSSHTSIDRVPDGVSGRMCNKLALKNTTLLEGDELGYGMIGELDEPMEEKDFLPMVKKTFGNGPIRHSDLTGKSISKVAVCGGSGASFIEKAIKAGADAYICGDLKHHDYFRAEGKLILVDVNHFESEQFTKELFFEQLSKKNCKFAIHFAKNDKSPIHLI